MMTTLKIKIVDHNSDAYRETVKLRDMILRKPLGLNYTEVQLQAELDSIHIACYFHDELVGCLILKPDGTDNLKMRQVAVSDKHQGLGIGRALVDFSEQYARENGYGKISMHARDTAVGFYLKLGYEVEGEPFEEVTIPHRSMFKEIGQCAE
jgi:ribosomal protein S18 acetylase RimI-like enzyme